MKEILDQVVPEVSEYADGRVAGRTLREIVQDRELLESLLNDREFKRCHRELFYDLQFAHQCSSIYRGFGLRSPKWRR